MVVTYLSLDFKEKSRDSSHVSRAKHCHQPLISLFRREALKVDPEHLIYCSCSSHLILDALHLLFCDSIIQSKMPFQSIKSLL